VPLIPKGYILLSRKLIESGIMDKPPEYLKVWIYLLSEACHKPTNNLERGQGFTSISKLIEVLSHKVGYRVQRPTKKQVWGIIEWLRNPYEGNHEGITKVPMIVTTKVTHGFVYTICNYEFYQDPKNYEGNSEGNDEGATKEQRKERQGNNKYKNVKNVKNDKNVKNERKVQYAEFVKMTPEEYQKLIDQFGKHATNRMIEILDNYKGSKGKTYKCDYRAILSWVTKRYQEEAQNGKDKQHTEKPKDMAGKFRKFVSS